MRLTESMIRQAIREEVANLLTESEGRGILQEGSSPSVVFNKIKDICEDALSNKSLGMKSAVAERFAGRIRDALKDLD